MSLTQKGGSNSDSNSFLSLDIKGGKMVQKMTEQDYENKVEGVTKRDFTNPSTGESGVAYELEHTNLTGFITEAKFVDLEFGQLFKLTVEKDGEKAILSFKTGADNYFVDFLKKIPNVDLTKEVNIAGAYDFTSTNKAGREKRYVGVTIKQGGEKIKGAYWDGKKSPKGYPKMEEANPDSDDWQIFFKVEAKYLKKQFIEKILPNIVPVEPSAAPVTKEQPVPQKEVADDDDLPF